MDARSVLIDQVLEWLSHMEMDFGPFSLALHSASLDDDDETHIDLKEFHLEGIGLHGKVAANLPAIGYHELPINLSMGIIKSLRSRECEVKVGDFDFEDNEHAEEDTS